MATLNEVLQRIHPNESCRRAASPFANWNRERLRAEIAAVGFESNSWVEKFWAEAEAAVEPYAISEAQRRMPGFLQDGPLALAGKPLDTLLGYIKSATLNALATSYDPAEHGGRLALGGTGVGKTVAGVALFQRLLAERIAAGARATFREETALVERVGHAHFDAAWVRAMDLPLARLQQRLGNGEAGLVQKARSASFLVLDDLGWETGRGGADDVVSEVIAARYDAGHVTYATSNFTQDELHQRYGSAVIRRLVESGGKLGKVIDLHPAKLQAVGA